MKKLTFDAFLEVGTDNVAAVRINNSEVTPIYLVEDWEAAYEENDWEELYGDDTYRFYGFGVYMGPNNWTLNAHDLSELGLLTAIGNRIEVCSGGLEFFHEEDDREGYVNVFDHLYQELATFNEPITILKLSDDELKQSWKQLDDGLYIIILE